jgi:hypothetical protein
LLVNRFYEEKDPFIKQLISNNQAHYVDYREAGEDNVWLVGVFLKAEALPAQGGITHQLHLLGINGPVMAADYPWQTPAISSPGRYTRHIPSQCHLWSRGYVSLLYNITSSHEVDRISSSTSLTTGDMPLLADSLQLALDTCNIPRYEAVYASITASNMWLAEYLLCQDPRLINQCDMSITNARYIADRRDPQLLSFIENSMASSPSTTSSTTSGGVKRTNRQMFTRLLTHCIQQLPIDSHNTSNGIGNSSGNGKGTLSLSRRQYLCDQLVGAGLDIEQVHTNGTTLLARCIIKYGHDCGLLLFGADGIAALNSLQQSITSTSSRLNDNNNGNSSNGQLHQLHESYLRGRIEEMRNARMMLQLTLDDVLPPLSSPSGIIYGYISWWRTTPLDGWRTLLLERLSRVTTLQHQLHQQDHFMTLLAHRLSLLESQR